MYSKQDNDDIPSIVNIYYQGSWAGMYKAKLVGDSSIVLRHGAISFPVGTALKVKFQRFAKQGYLCNRISGIVSNNSSNGMLLSLKQRLEYTAK
jgi:hypothetical protein